ncbi:PepSY-associated TM helix domain-containing protein [Sphingobacterium sp. HJSM2_6]|uniref:PepSY-associated TM helix domain-containing protein n=1 Tax=Sphingobacterium sp. HJSM2_6 TaxID=3366264 RepID=UPI003BCE997D
MQVKNAKRWFNWHKWTSLISTLFLLLLCITGLPLIFTEEIEHYLTKLPTETQSDNQKKSQDELIKIAESKNPGKKVRYAYWDYDEHPNQVLLDLSERPSDDFEKSNYFLMSENSGKVLIEPKNEGFMYIMLKLHTDLFAGIPGKLFLGIMGLLLLIAIISGIVLYGPIMKNYDFGMIRHYKSNRLRWLDTHNLIGITTMAWLFVVGFTGVINTLSDVVLGLWQQGQLAEMTAPYQHYPPILGKPSSLDQAVQTASATVPHMKVVFVAFPGTIFTSKHHYAVFMKGNTELTARLLMPVLIDAETGEFTDARPMPWYVNTLFLSQPLHFGDYGGLPLKIIWALFDIASIIILITGLYLWYHRRKAKIQFIPKHKPDHENSTYT